ncbi:MAG: orotidine-5'-phosphate decarboxylase [Leptospirales bacterium]|jgi:orotidine-5'-phosphate decarboxylase
MQFSRKSLIGCGPARFVSLVTGIPGQSSQSFRARFAARRKKKRSVLCVGLDPDPEKIPAGYESASVSPDSPALDGEAQRILAFLADIIAATADRAVAYKPNLAFFECLGAPGMLLFEQVLRLIREKAPGALIVADAKRGDIGNTAERYARAFFGSYDCDAITLSPYMGMDTLDPFVSYGDRAVIALCHTSNSGAAEFQNVGEPPLYLRVAAAVQKKNLETGNLWLVVGATRDPSSIERIRATAPDVPFLIPGVGAQGGDLEGALRAAGPDVLINAGRALLYAANGRDAVASAAAEEADRMLSVMRQVFDFDRLPD